MNKRHAAHVQRMVDAVLSRPGETDPALRRAIEAWAAKLGRRPSAEVVETPAELTGYVTKVALHAYRIRDEDIETLRKAGYSEESLEKIREVLLREVFEKLEGVVGALGMIETGGKGGERKRLWC